MTSVSIHQKSLNIPEYNSLILTLYSLNGTLYSLNLPFSTEARKGEEKTEVRIEAQLQARLSICAQH